MKKILAVILSSLILCTAVGCSSGNNDNSKTSFVSSVSKTESSEESKTSSEYVSSDISYDEDEDEGIKLTCEDAELKENLEEIINQYEFKGVFYVARGGKPLAYYAGGEVEDGINVEISTPKAVFPRPQDFRV